MGKTPKKPAPGGDESNLYVRRLKATTTASLKACDTSLAARQRESENPNRGKTIGVQKRLPVPVGKVFKSKLRSPATTKSHKALKNPTRFQPSTSKDERKPAGLFASTVPKERESTDSPTMYPESEEAAVQLKVSITKKDVKDAGRVSGGEESSGGGGSAKDETETSQGHANSNGKEAIELAETENPTPRADSDKEEHTADKSDSDKSATKEQTSEEKLTESRDDAKDSSDAPKNDSRHEDSEAENASCDFETNALKLEDEEEPPKHSERNGESQEITRSGQKDKDAAEIEETIQDEEPKKSSENCSEDVVESTTSETSDSGNATQSDKEQQNSASGDRAKDNTENDASFISYDSSIMLKDVQIKLNDCLKDNSKLFDISNANDDSGATAANDAEQQKRLDMSFGKTLRSISGRSTINRLRHVTLREHRFSPNSSLFVNTSSASLDFDEPASCKLLRRPSEFSNPLSTNGSPADRKRKIVTESAASVKKLKTERPERTNILNTSLEILKSLRRPIQVSTPNPKNYKFSEGKDSPKSCADDKLTVEAEVESKKWCIVM